MVNNVEDRGETVRKKEDVTFGLRRVWIHERLEKFELLEKRNQD